MPANLNPATLNIECLVVGGGPAGLAAATALAHGGTNVALAGFAPPTAPEHADTRTAALFPPVVRLLQRLGAWDGLADVSAPLLAIRIADGTGGLLRAPEVMFRASEIQQPDLGQNVPNAALNIALAAAATRAGVQLLEDCRIVSVATAADAATARTARGLTIRARLIVGADGRDSVCRQAAGIAVERWTYDQAAIAVQFAHTRPHHGISTEIHRPAGPCTTVPLPGPASSLVWVERPGEVERLMAASPRDFIAELAAHLGGLLGDITDLGIRRAFPLTGLKAETLARNRVALVGEAGHVLPPIGAQGLNLGLFDVAVLADRVAQVQRPGGRSPRDHDPDIGAHAVLDDYARARAADIGVRQGAVDLLNRTLTSGWLPLDLARGAGLHLLASAPGLRQRIMEQGLSPPAPLPALMRGDLARGDLALANPASLERPAASHPAAAPEPGTP